MTTFGVMRDRIVDEINRPDLADAVEAAILSAIDHYKARRFWFNTAKIDGADTVAGDDFLDYPAGLLALDTPRPGIPGSLFIDAGGGFDPLTKETAATLQMWGATSNGAPYAYAELGAQVQIYPKPAGAYPTQWLGVVALSTLSADGDSNAWTTIAEQVIRNRAKAYVNCEYRNHAQAQAEAAAMILRPNCDGCISALELAALRSLKLENTKRASRGALRRN